MIINEEALVFLKNKRSKSEIWKKADIEKYFELMEIKDKKVYEAYLNFSLIPTSRFEGSLLTKERRMDNFNDILYFRLMGIDREVNPDFVRYVDCGFVALKKDTFRRFKL